MLTRGTAAVNPWTSCSVRRFPETAEQVIGGGDVDGAARLEQVLSMVTTPKLEGPENKGSAYTDLSTAKRTLGEVAHMALRAAKADDPREVWTALAVLELQNASIRELL